MAKVDLKECFVEKKYCEKVGKNVSLYKQYHPTLKVEVGEEYCEYTTCKDLKCPYNQKNKKI